MAGARHAPAFAEYWKPDTDFYGDPVYGGTLRINYEDPLEHGNTWGASTGAATRLRNATMNRIISDSPYDNTLIIPDLAQAGRWTRASPAPPSTSTTISPGTTESLSSVRMPVSPLRPGLPVTVSLPLRTRPPSASLTLDNTSCIDDLTLHIGYNGPTPRRCWPSLTTTPSCSTRSGSLRVGKMPCSRTFP